MHQITIIPFRKQFDIHTREKKNHITIENKASKIMIYKGNGTRTKYNKHERNMREKPCCTKLRKFEISLETMLKIIIMNSKNKI